MSAIFLSSPPGRIRTYSNDGAIAQSALQTLVWEVTSKTDWKITQEFGKTTPFY